MDSANSSPTAAQDAPHRPGHGAGPSSAASSPRKVLLVETGPGHGGSAFSLFRLVKSLDWKRYQPQVVAFQDAESFAQIRALGVPVSVASFFRPLLNPSGDDGEEWSEIRKYWAYYGNLGADTVYNGIQLARRIRREKISLVHLNNGIAENLAAAFAARLARVPCVTHVRGSEPLLRIEKYLHEWIAAAITLNRSVFDSYVASFGRDKVHLIYNGVDLDAFENPDPQRIRRELAIEPGTFAVGTFARLVEGKGIPEFITAAAQVHRHLPNARFFVVGHDATEEGAFAAKVKSLASELGLRQHLTFTGWRHDRIDVMAAMDLVLQVSTTFPEGMSLVPLEAMALAKPIIVTRIPGYEFCVDEGKSGFVTAPGDTDDLAAKMLHLARDPDLTRRFGREGRRRAEQQFDVRLTADKVQQIYDDVLSVSSRRNPDTAIHA